MILYYKKKSSFRITKVVVKKIDALENGETYFNCDTKIPEGSILSDDGLCKNKLYKIGKCKIIEAHYFQHQATAIPKELDESYDEPTMMEITSSRIVDREQGKIEIQLAPLYKLPEETKCTHEEATEIIKDKFPEMLKPHDYSDVDKYMPEQLEETTIRHLGTGGLTSKQRPIETPIPDFQYRMMRQLKRTRNNLLELNKISKPSEHGYMEIGYNKGKISTLENTLDELYPEWEKQYN